MTRLTKKGVHKGGAGEMTGKEAMEALFNLVPVENVEEATMYVHEIKRDLEVLEILKNILDNNTLFRVFPYKTAKSFSDFIKTEEKVKEWLEK